MKEIKPRSNIHASLNMPGSKSITHRAVIAATLASGESRLKNFLACEDTLYTIRTLQKLGIQMGMEQDTLIIEGTGGIFPPALPASKEFYLGNSGTSIRLLLSVVALAQGEWLLSGTPRMQQRPVGDLVLSLNRLGIDACCLNNDGCPPVRVRGSGSIPGGKVRIRGEKSSQFLSSLLLVSPYCKSGMEIEVDEPLVSRPYVELTVQVMEDFGIQVKHESLRHFWINQEQSYRGRDLQVEGDVSNASYFWAAAAVTGGKVDTGNIQAKSKQGDMGFLEMLATMGCRVEKTYTGVSVEGGGSLKGLDVDMSTMPDLVPTLAVLGLFAKGKTSIRNVSHLRYKESDRLHALTMELSRLGGKVDEFPDGLLICGGEKLRGAEVETYNDHRLAMSLAIAGLRVPGVRIKNAQCVNKSFPQFWKFWEKL
jgi:3-phosphoshikimate 1-carboxyvinyltransferase